MTFQDTYALLSKLFLKILTPLNRMLRRIDENVHT